MEVLQDLLRKLKSIPTKEFVAEIVQENKHILEDLNAEQLESGIDSNGNIITPGYSALTKAIKAAKGQPIDRVTAKDTGDYHSAIRVQAESNGFKMGNGDWKARKLSDRYGPLMGLTAENITGFSHDVVKEEMTEKVRNYIVRP